jgi:hypothetical protein
MRHDATPGTHRAADMQQGHVARRGTGPSTPCGLCAAAVGGWVLGVLTLGRFRPSHPRGRAAAPGRRLRVDCVPRPPAVGYSEYSHRAASVRRTHVGEPRHRAVGPVRTVCRGRRRLGTRSTHTGPLPSGAPTWEGRRPRADCVPPPPAVLRRAAACCNSAQRGCATTQPTLLQIRGCHASCRNSAW